MELKKREEIIKMLECWTSEYGCKDCPFIEQGCFDCGHIPLEISQSILALIKELANENKRLNRDFLIQQKIINERAEDILRHDGFIRDLHKQITTTKADTVRKMQSKLTDKSEFALRADDDGGMYYVDHLVWIEEVAKEILEGKNDV